MSEVTARDAGARQVSRTVWVDSPAAPLFDLAANPHRHHELDGSGTVKPAAEGPDRLSQGASFTVGMQRGPVFKYKVTSKVVAFEPDRVVEWQCSAGHRWRWEFTPEGEGTRVTETFDYRGLSAAKTFLMEKVLRAPIKNGQGIEASLRKLRDHPPA